LLSLYRKKMATMRDLPPIQPGEQLGRPTKDISMPVTRIQDIVAERCAITGDRAACRPGTRAVVPS
jgi:hypothetical protein